MKINTVSQKIAITALLTAIMMILGYIEKSIPFLSFLPGAKIGLSNIVVLLAFYLLGEKQALLITVIKITVNGLLFSGLNGMIYAGMGGILAYLVMILCFKAGKFSMIGVSVAGAVAHNIGQIAAACFMMNSLSLVYYLPVLMILGVFGGAVTGVLGSLVYRHLKNNA